VGNKIKVSLSVTKFDCFNAQIQEEIILQEMSLLRLFPRVTPQAVKANCCGYLETLSNTVIPRLIYSPCRIQISHFNVSPLLLFLPFAEIANNSPAFPKFDRYFYGIS
jgi:hypothetical protein